jgi:hypothetical protein
MLSSVSSDPASPGSGSSPIPFTRSRSIADSAPPPLNRTRSNPPTARERDSKENGARVESDQIFVNAVLDEPKADDAVQPETKHLVAPENQALDQQLHVAIASIRKLQGLVFRFNFVVCDLLTFFQLLRSAIYEPA